MRLSVASIGMGGARFVAPLAPPAPLPPLLTGAVGPINRTHDGANFSIETAQAFSGDVTSYGLSSVPPGVVIDVVTGRVSVPPQVYAAALIEVVARNAQGASEPLQIILTQAAPAGVGAGSGQILAMTISTQASLVTPAGQPGDRLVLMVDTSGADPVVVTASGGETVLTDDINLRASRDNSTAQIHHIELSAETTGLTLEVISPVTVRQLQCFNIGPQNIVGGAVMDAGFGSGAQAFPTLSNLPAHAMVMYFHASRTGTGGTIEGTGALALAPALPTPTAEYVDRAGRNLVDIITLGTQGGSTPPVNFVPAAAVSNRSGVVVAFAPAGGQATPLSPPVLTGGLASIERIHDGSDFGIETATHFSGTIDTYAIASAPAGVVLNPVTGQITVPPQVYAAALIAVVARNADGTSDPLEFFLTQGEPPVVAAAGKILASTVGTDVTLNTPSGLPGDMMVIFADTNGTNPVTLSASNGETVLTDGTNLRVSGDNATAQIFYIKLAAPTTGLTLQVTSAVTVRRLHCFNIGPHDFVSGAMMTSGFGSGAVDFPVLSDLPAHAMVMYFHARRTGDAGTIEGTGTLVQNPSLPAASGEYVERTGRNLLDIIQLDAVGGNSPAVRLVPAASLANRGGVVAAFVPVANAGGAVLPGQYIADDNGAGLARSSTRTSFDVESASFTLAAPAQVGHYLTGNIGLGDIWVRPPGGAGTVTVTGYTPVAGVMGDGRQGNGAMLNIGPLSNAAGQGFDETAGNTGIAWNASRRANVPIVMSPGDVLVVATSRNIADAPRCIETFFFVHCVADVPFEDEFAPPYMWDASLGARPRYRYSAIDEAALPTLSTGGFANARPAPSLLEQPLARRLLDPVGAWNRYNLRADNHGATYGRDYQRETDPAWAYVVSDAPVAQKRRLLAALVQRGIDTYGVLRSARAQGAARWLYPDGGHHGGRKAQVVMAGHLLGDAGMRDWIGANTTPMTDSAIQEDGMRTYLTPAAITATRQAGWKGAGSKATGSTHIPYPDAMGQAPAVPEWTGGPVEGTGGLDPTALNNLWEGNANFYRLIGHTETASGQTVALLAMGLRATWNQEAFFDVHARWYGLEVHGDDPWRYVDGNPAPRYPLLFNAPGGRGGVPNGFEQELYGTHAFQGALYAFPVGVNGFNGAT